MTEEQENDVVNEFQVERLNFCGCGNPLGNLEWILEGMNLVDERMKPSPKPWGSPENRAWWEAIDAKELAHFGNERARDFFWYWLDDQEFTEHGGSIPGWLTQKGVKFRDELASAIRQSQ